MAMATEGETWRKLSDIYEKLKSSCCCLENGYEMKKTIQDSIESNDYADNDKLYVGLLGLNTVNLLGRILWQRNHCEFCIKLEWLSRNIISVDIINKLVGTLLKCDNNHIIYSTKKCFLALLFNYPKETSMQVEKYLLSFLTQSVSEGKTNCNVLDLLHKIVFFERPKVQSFYSDSTLQDSFICHCHHTYDMDDRCNEIKSNCINAVLHVWSDLLVYSKGESSNDEIKFLMLELWSCLIITSLQLQLDMKDILTEQSRKEILDISYHSSSTVCAKVFEVLNQVMSIDYLQTGEILPVGIIPLSEDIFSRTKNAWLDNISLKINCNFIGKQAAHMEPDFVHLRNITLVMLKSVNIIIKCNEQTQPENILLVLEILMGWLRNKWNESRVINTDQKYLIELFFDQDDQLVEMMICTLNIYIWLQKASRVDISSSEDVTQIFNPHVIFLLFVKQLSYDYSLLLDLLMSNETCALFYLLQYLKLVTYEWHNFVYSHELMKERQDVHVLPSKHYDERSIEGPNAFDAGNDDSEQTDSSNKLFKNNWVSSVHATIEMLAQLCSRLQTLEDKALFPYNARPLIRILNDCEKLYNCNRT